MDRPLNLKKDLITCIFNKSVFGMWFVHHKDYDFIGELSSDMKRFKPSQYFTEKGYGIYYLSDLEQEFLRLRLS